MGIRYSARNGPKESRSGMADFHIHIDEWLDAGDVRSPELRETWCRLRMTLDDRSLIELQDHATGSTRYSLYLPAYVLAEWLVDRYMFHIHEYHKANAVREAEYSYRHNLRYNREGYLFPEIMIEPRSESQIAVTVRRMEYTTERKTFALEQQFLVDRTGFEYGVRRFIEAVLARLEDRGVAETYLAQRWSEYVHADPEEVDFITTMATMGVHHAVLEDSQSNAFLRAWELLPEDVARVMVRHVSFDDVIEHAERFAELVRLLEEHATEARELDTIRRELRHEIPLQQRPWHYGYLLARAFREKLGIEEGIITGPESIDRCVGRVIPRSEQDLFSHEMMGRLRAMIYTDPESARVHFGLAHAVHPVPALFNYCRALGEYLIAGTGRYVAVSGIDHWDQQVNRAFAAELLLPVLLLKKRIDAPTVQWHTIDEVAREYHVSSELVRWQLLNQTSIQLEED